MTIIAKASIYAEEPFNVAIVFLVIVCLLAAICVVDWVRS